MDNQTMHIKNLTDGYTCSAQISKDELKHLHEQGVKSVICFRPDGEHPEQPEFDTLTREASELGLVCYYLPYDVAQVSAELMHRCIESSKRHRSQPMHSVKQAAGLRCHWHFPS
jgi:uncharacterized protein (TIGR01244 family)